MPRNRRGVSDLEAFLRAPGFSGSVVDGPIDTVMAALPQLANVVGVTAAGPVITNDVGTPTLPKPSTGHCAASATDWSCGSTRPHWAPSSDRSIRVGPADCPGLRHRGQLGARHPTSSRVPDRLAFESLSLSRSADVDILDDLALQRQQASRPPHRSPHRVRRRSDRPDRPDPRRRRCRAAPRSPRRPDQGFTRIGAAGDRRTRTRPRSPCR